MEKTLEIRLKEQREEIIKKILDFPTPENMIWESKIGFQTAKTIFTTLIKEHQSSNIAE